MQRLSVLLKNRREYLNYPLEKISEATKIRLDYLNALENQKYDLFPSEVYLKGILQIYSRFLGLDNNLVQALYRREQTMSDKTKKIQPLSKEFDTPKFIITSNKLIVFAIILSVTIVGIFVSTQVARLTATPTLRLSEPIVIQLPTSEGVFKTDKESIVIAGKAEVGSNIYLNNQKIALNPLNEFRIEGYQIKLDSNVLIVKAENQFGKTSEIKLNVFREKANEVVTPVVQGNSNVVAIDKMDLSINVLEESNIKLSLDGVSKINRIVPKNTIIDATTRADLGMSAFRIIEINTNNADKIKVNINKVEYILKQGDNKFELINGVVIQK